MKDEYDLQDQLLEQQTKNIQANFQKIWAWRRRKEIVTSLQGRYESAKKSAEVDIQEFFDTGIKIVLGTCKEKEATSKLVDSLLKFERTIVTLNSSIKNFNLEMKRFSNLETEFKENTSSFSSNLEEIKIKKPLETALREQHTIPRRKKIITRNNFKPVVKEESEISIKPYIQKIEHIYQSNHIQLKNNIEEANSLILFLTEMSKKITKYDDHFKNIEQTSEQRIDNLKPMNDILNFLAPLKQFENHSKQASDTMKNINHLLKKIENHQDEEMEEFNDDEPLKIIEACNQQINKLTALKAECEIELKTIKDLASYLNKTSINFKDNLLIEKYVTMEIISWHPYNKLLTNSINELRQDGAEIEKYKNQIIKQFKLDIKPSSNKDEDFEMDVEQDEKPKLSP